MSIWSKVKKVVKKVAAPALAITTLIPGVGGMVAVGIKVGSTIYGGLKTGGFSPPGEIAEVLDGTAKLVDRVGINTPKTTKDTVDHGTAGQPKEGMSTNTMLLIGAVGVAAFLMLRGK